LQGLDRYRVVAVRIFDADETDPRRPLPGAELALLWRVYDPAFSRNPDAIKRLDQDSILELIQLILTGGGTREGGSGRSPLEREGGRLR
jgi:hypothetical protein